MKNTTLLVLLVLLAICYVESTKTKVKSKTKNKSKNKSKLKSKKMNTEEQQKAKEMIRLLSSYLGDKDGAAAKDGAATKDPAAKDAGAKDPAAKDAGAKDAGAKDAKPAKKAGGVSKAPLKDPRFDDRIGLADIVMKADDKKVAHSQLIMEDLENMPGDYKELEVTKECQLKQGYLGLVTEVDESKGKESPILTARAVFAVLNKKSMSFFNKENINALVKTVDIQHLKPSYFPVTWKGLFCWQLVPAAKVFMMEEYVTSGAAAIPEEQVSATLCAPTKAKMDEWLLSIQRFHNCVVQPAPAEQQEEASEVDKLTGWYKTLKSRQVKGLKDDEEEGDEDNQDEINKMKAYMEGFKKDILNKKAEGQQERREKTVELEEAIEETKAQQMQNECMDKALEIRGEEEERQVEQMIQSESQTREQKELDKKKKDLMNNLDQESKKIIDGQSDLTDAVRKMREDMKQKMVQTVIGLNKREDVEMCYFLQAIFPKDVRTTDQKIHYTCEKLVDIQNVDIDLTNQCLLEKQFCRVCCNYNVGELLAAEREKCQETCNDQLTGNVPSDQFTMHFDLENNVKKQKKDEEELKKKMQELQRKQFLDIQKEQKQQTAKEDGEQKEREKDVYSKF